MNTLLFVHTFWSEKNDTDGLLLYMKGLVWWVDTANTSIVIDWMIHNILEFIDHIVYDVSH